MTPMKNLSSRLPAAMVIVILVLGLPVHLPAQAAKPMPKEVAALLADYQKEFTKAKEPSDKVLRTEATKIAARLVGEGKAEDAKLIGTQVEDKAAGKPVAAPHAELVNLFGLYDNAVAAAAKPIREKYASRVNAMLQGPAAKDMSVVIALGEAKKVVDGTVPQPATPVASSAGTSTSGGDGASRSEVEQQFVGKKWANEMWAGKWQVWDFQRGGKLVITRAAEGRVDESKWYVDKKTNVMTVEYTNVIFEFSVTSPTEGVITTRAPGKEPKESKLILRK